MLRSSGSHSVGNMQRIQCSEIIQMLILEAMYAVEESEQISSTFLNRYNWIHLSHLVTYALCASCCTLQQLLNGLELQLKNCRYSKAKGELMWILLQYISIAKPKLNSTSGSHRSQLDSSKPDLGTIFS